MNARRPSTRPTARGRRDATAALAARPAGATHAPRPGASPPARRRKRALHP
ncbi:hypothetical protein GBP346_A0082 [Burkholderia pseudomallei MSHR346]|nr:hypothetical protein GBP346_A0082 [Burkholderia pseudomallei MSHR346]